jgi:hypothetical protein
MGTLVRRQTFNLRFLNYMARHSFATTTNRAWIIPSPTCQIGSREERQWLLAATESLTDDYVVGSRGPNVRR